MQEHNRLIDVYWNDNVTENYTVGIEVLAVNTNDVLKNIIQDSLKSVENVLEISRKRG